MRLPHEAATPAVELLSDQACGCHTSHLPDDRMSRATRHPAAMVNRALPDATFQAGPPNVLAFSCRERAARDHIKTRPILREKRSAARPGSAAPASVCSLRRLPFRLMAVDIGKAIFLG